MTSDEHNVKKVAAGRIDAAVIDVNVVHYLLKQEALLPLEEEIALSEAIFSVWDEKALPTLETK
ncbi:MAG: hypothetical protein ACRC6S_12020 [Shewanella sp.]